MPRVFLFQDRGAPSGGFFEILFKLVDGDIEAVHDRGGVAAGIEFHRQPLVGGIGGGGVDLLQRFDGEGEGEMIHAGIDHHHLEDVQAFRGVHDGQEAALLAVKIHGQITGAVFRGHGQAGDDHRALVGVVLGEAHIEGRVQLQRLAQGRIDDAPGHRRGFGTGDAVVGAERGMFPAGEHAGAVKGVHAERIVLGHVHVGDGALLHQIDLRVGAFGQRVGHNVGKLGAADALQVGIVLIVGGEDAVLHGVVHISLIPGSALHEDKTVAGVGAVDAGGKGDGLGQGDVAVGGEHALAGFLVHGALHQAVAVYGGDMGGVPAGNVAEGILGIGVDRLEIVESICRGGRGAGAEQGGQDQSQKGGIQSLQARQLLSQNHGGRRAAGTRRSLRILL